MKKFLFFMLLLLSVRQVIAQDVLKVGVAGLSHDHVHVLLQAYKRQEVTLLGIAEADKGLMQRYQEQYKLPDSLFFSDVASMLSSIKPDAVLAYNAIAEHLSVAEACLPLHIPLMVEKPLAMNTKQAKRMAALSQQYNTLVLTNFETTWYSSVQTLKTMVTNGEVGKLHKMIAKDGHQGPKEIGCSEAFLSWLTHPDMNGGGALVDFGCYGANLMTWLMDGRHPASVTAVTRHIKPDVYPLVDDDATILLEYADGTSGIIQASWDWPYSIKDLQVYGDRRSFHAVDANTLHAYKNPKAQENVSVTDAYYKDHLTYLKAVLDGKIDASNDLSSLQNNLIVVEILEAAKQSATSGKRVQL